MMAALLDILLLLILPFLFLGTVNRVKSFWAGRTGPALLQPFRDFLKLMGKGEVISSVTTAVFRIGPCVNFAAVLTAGLLVPLVSRRAVLGFEGDFILFAYILGLGKFFTILSALDTGSAFEGMGASREAAFSSLAEPGFFLTVASLAAIAGGASFARILEVFPSGGGIALLVAVLAGIALFILMLAEGSRMPVDDPNTHLELTMIHEVMVLDNSGPDLALINYASGMKMVIFGGLIAALFNPFPVNPYLSAAACAGIVLLLAAGVGLVESFTARLRMVHVPQFLLVMTSLALITLATVILFLKSGA